MESKYWMVAEHTAGLNVGIGGLESFWKIEERSFHELHEFKRDPERDSSISMEFLS